MCTVIEFHRAIFYRSIARSDLDFTYITSRVAVMGFPAEGLEAAYYNHADDVRALLEGRHPGHFTVYNISGRTYSPNRFVASSML